MSLHRPNYFIRLGDATSQLFNVVLLNGDANESISGRAHRQGWRVAEVVINAMLRPLEPDHCRTAYLEDVARARELIEEATT